MARSQLERRFVDVCRLMISDTLETDLRGSRLRAQAQKIRTRQTRHHMRVLEDVHFIASPTTFRTAPPIPRGATEGGHSDLVLVGRLMQYVLPVAASPHRVVSLQDSRRS